MPLKDPIKRREWNRQYMIKWKKTPKGAASTEESRRKYGKSPKRRLATYSKRRYMIPLVLDRKIREGCLFCRERHPRALDYHHIDRKTKKCNISYYASRAVSPDKLLTEIAKCVVICVNCHRRIWYWEEQFGRSFPVWQFKRRGQIERFRRMTEFVEPAWVAEARESMRSGKYFNISRKELSPAIKAAITAELNAGDARKPVRKT